MAMSKFSKSSAALLLLCTRTPNPIPFVSKLKKIHKVDETDMDKSEWIKLEFLMDPDNTA
jgi:hypothetical protein